MPRWLAFLTLAQAVFVTTTAAEPPVTEIVDLGGGAFDIHVADLGDGSVWTVGFLCGNTDNGARLVYSTDPNTGRNLLVQNVPIGTGRTDVTFVSLPRGQEVARRFDRRSEPLIAGAACGSHHQQPEAAPNRIDVAWFQRPLGTLGTGYVARVVLDLTDVTVPLGTVYASVGTPPVGTALLATGWLATTTDTFTDASATTLPWYVAVPEPSGLALLLLCGLAATRR